jgi:hypothetical protein
MPSFHPSTKTIDDCKSSAILFATFENQVAKGKPLAFSSLSAPIEACERVAVATRRRSELCRIYQFEMLHAFVFDRFFAK